MTLPTADTDCTRRCQYAALGLGGLIFVIGWIAGWGFWAAIIVGFVVAAVGFVLFPRLFCPLRADDGQSFAPADPVAAPARAPAAEPAAKPEPAPAPVAEPAPRPEPVPEADSAEEALIKPSTPLPGQAELATRKGEWRYEPDMAEPSAEDQPADDLRRISGVGPALEKKLHGAGITRFAQIAAWTDADVARMDDLLSFKGRITRDNWIEQARALTTERASQS